MADKVFIGTVKMFDRKGKRGVGVIVPSKIPNVQTSQKPVYFEAPEETKLRVGQLVRFVVDDANPDDSARDVAVVGESTD